MKDGEYRKDIERMEERIEGEEGMGRRKEGKKEDGERWVNIH